MFLEKLDEFCVYENPNPVLRARCAKFPGLIRLPSGELIALFELGEAFEAVDCRTVISRSADSGKNWRLQGELYETAKLGLPFPVSETLKPLLLRDGNILATGYRFHRQDAEKTVGNPETSGVLPGDVVVTGSNDHGRTWTLPQVIEHGFPETVELSGPCIETASGDIVGIGALFKMWDGRHPSEQHDILIRSRDKGRTWDTRGRFFTTPGKNIAPYEARIVEMQPGRLVTISWAYDLDRNRNLPNLITVSHDNGHSWSAPIDTGIHGQASNLTWLGGDRLLMINTQREGKIGLYVRLVDFKNEVWKVKDESLIWGNGVSETNSENFIDHCQGLRFGQPSLLSLGGDELLAYHWCIENNLYVIKAHRLRLHLRNEAARLEQKSLKKIDGARVAVAGEVQPA